MQYDLFIPAAKKDFNKVPYTIKCALQNLHPKPENIVIVSPQKFCDKLVIDGYSIKNFIDSEVIKTDLNKFSYRPTWINQQLIKLLQDVTPNENYLLIDSDFFITKNINIELENFRFYLSLDQNHRPYFKFQEKFFGFGRVFNYSFTSEIMMFNKTVMSNMLSKKGMDKEDFIQYCYENINNYEYINEQEFYGSYVYNTFKNVSFTNLNTVRNGKLCKPDEVVYADDEIEAYISFAIKNNLDGIGLHSWI